MAFAYPVSSNIFRTLIDYEPFPETGQERPPWEGRGTWPCRWIGAEDAGAPCIFAYRNRFVLNDSAVIRVHVTADERYELFLDGMRIGRGSERGDPQHWAFETYDLTLAAGEHVIVGKVWSLGGLAPVAQMSLRHGFLLAPEEACFHAVLGTGLAEWQVKKIAGFEYVRIPQVDGTGPRTIIDGAQIPWGFERGNGEDWEPVRKLEAGAVFSRRNDYGAVHLLKPATLSPMLEQKWAKGVVRQIDDESDLTVWGQFLLGGGEIPIPAGREIRVLVDLEDYLCAYTELVVSGGAGSRIQILWAEALTSPVDGAKGNRDETEGRIFSGIGNIYKPDGGDYRRFESLWWEAGRYLEIQVKTSGEALTLHSLALQETRYPLEMESTFAASDFRLAQIAPMLLRSLQTCSHETFMDCPYYEQMMYAGDTRTEALTMLTITRDDRLIRKSLELFGASQLSSGLTQSRYPSRCTQIIPPFALWWVGMVSDYAKWRGDLPFIKGLMPLVRRVMDKFLDRIGIDGWVHSPAGWNFTDWVKGWNFGVPPGGDDVSGVLQLQFILALKMVGELEAYCGRSELAAQAHRFGRELAARVESGFWSEERGMFADDLAAEHYSEHSQALAILGDCVGEGKKTRIAHVLIHDTSLARTGVYFSHYLFEAFYALEMPDALMRRLEFWFDLPAMGFKTTPETADPSRSDCHAWGAHPLYHYFASVLGIRPSAMGFEKVRIAPQLGSLSHASGKMVHPWGDIAMDFRAIAGRMSGTITLPAGLTGEFVWDGTTVPLHSGTQNVC